MSLLKEGKSLGLESVGLTGGEPFLRLEKLTELVIFCRNKLGVAVHVHTNRTKISRDEASWLEREKVEVSISMFGSDPRTHDAITNTEGSMKSTLRGLKNLVDVNAKLTVFVVPMRSNFEEIPSLIEMIRAERVRDVRILILAPTGRALSRFGEIELTGDERMRLGKELGKLRRKRDVHLRAGFCTRHDFPDLEGLNGHERCYAARNRVHIDAFGNVYPCTASSGRKVFSAGNVQLTSGALTEIWRFSPLLQFFRAYHSNPTKRCQSCIKFGDCMSGCRVQMSYRYGDATIADPQCGGPYSATAIAGQTAG